MTKKQVIERAQKSGIKVDPNLSKTQLMGLINRPSTLVKPVPVPLAETKRAYTTNCIVKDLGCPCNHCGEKYDHRVQNTYPNGNRRMICSNCKKPFMAIRGV